MYPFYRYTKSIIKAIAATKKGETIDLEDTAEIQIRCSLTDIDNFIEMNNGRVLTLYDFGRTDFAIRSGLGKKLLEKRWGLVVAGSTIQYRKRIRPFDLVTIKTHIAAIDERWVYMEQSMWVKGKPCSTALLRTGVTKGGKVIDTQEILDALGQSDLKLLATGYVAEWIESEADRPWPPRS
ncbi:acyl-CoA thioesterase [Psychrobacter sp.]|uniref:acyl-CoA thioesterase n=1 Tax=Psychrobacter sp. TaxID=56811 RepID=UPI0025EB44F6|nr:acyl-CoA thioesterase [Psychrobacter sp.]